MKNEGKCSRAEQGQRLRDVEVPLVYPVEGRDAEVGERKVKGGKGWRSIVEGINSEDERESGASANVEWLGQCGGAKSRRELTPSRACLIIAQSPSPAAHANGIAGLRRRKPILRRSWALRHRLVPQTQDTCAGLS